MHMLFYTRIFCPVKKRSNLHVYWWTIETHTKHLHRIIERERDIDRERSMYLGIVKRIVDQQTLNSIYDT